jgi:hypothetical protein
MQRHILFALHAQESFAIPSCLGPVDKLHTCARLSESYRFIVHICFRGKNNTRGKIEDIMSVRGGVDVVFQRQKKKRVKMRKRKRLFCFLFAGKLSCDT